MTIAIGFTCSDSLLICADTQLTVTGITKLHGSKIYREEYPNGAKSAIAIAGTLRCARQAMQHVEYAIGDLAATQATIRNIRVGIESEIIEMHRKHIYPHPDGPSFQLLIGVWSPVNSRAVMFWNEDSSLCELRGYQPIGAGDALAHYIIKGKEYKPTMTAARVRPIGVEAIAKAKDWVDGCGGFTEVISISRNGILGPTERLPTPTAT